MGPCEQLVEPACVSPRVFVADGVEEIVANAAAEGFLERAVEPVLSLSSVERGGGDSVIESVAQKRCLLDSGGALGELGMEDRSESIIMYDCLKPSFKTSEGFVGRIELECADGGEESVCDALGERLDELVLMPISEEFCKLDQSSGTIENSYENARDIGPGTACIDADVEPVIERHDVKCEHADNKSESGNASSIKSCLNKIYLEGGQCECEMNSCHLNLTKDGLLPLGKPQVAGALSGSAALCMSDFKADSDIAGSPVETVGAGTMDNGAFKSSVIPDTFGLDSCVATPNHIGDTEKDNAWTDGGTCDQKFTEASFLPLRRSSRSKKSVQQLHKGKNATKGTKKAPKVSLSRTIDLLSEATRKKRSSLSRSICPSSWGRSENLSKYFQQNNEISKNQTIGHRPGKKKAGQRSRKKNMLKVVASSQSSERQQEVPCRRIRLKVTFGGKEELTRVDGMPSAVVDALPGNEGKGLNLFTYIDSSEGNVMDSSVSVEIPRLMQCNNSTSNVQLVGSNLDICPESGKCSHEGSSQFDRGDRSCMDKLSDPGTSPDSEVIDQVHDSIIGPRESCGNVFPGSNSFPATLKKSKNRRYKDKLCQAGNPVLEYQHSADRAKVSKRGTQPQKVVDGLCGTDNVDMDSENLPSNTSGSELVFTELLPVVDEVSPSAPSLGSGADNTTYSRMNIVIESANSGNSCQLSPPKEIQGKRKSKGSRAKGKPRNKSELMDAVRHEKEHSKQQKGKNKLSSKNKVTETGILSEAYKIRAQPGTGNHDVADVEKADSSNEVPLKNAFCLGLVPTGAGEQTLASRVAWVCCDDCLKWRCIPAELADAIEETNCRWTCKDNQDQAFADCSIPQKKSNAEINAELQISDEDDARDGHLGSMDSGLGQSVASQPSTWMLVKSNLFLHRSRKALTMDEIMVCHCKPPVDGRLGCGSQCLNRMLNIECIQGTCPCGDRCSNQLFQKQQYVKLSWFRCGKKGYGLQVLEHISEGQFLIEYVGEVLDLQSYEARQKDYAAKGHKHFYFMTLNGNEVIDASAKGNLGRFVNHSCDPNCRTEKWVVNGEICVGLFAMRNIKKGEELTFDYNYVRVFGAAAKKCHCGSRKCRGYIGGDPLNAQVIVQGDSDEEFPEPVVVDENGKIDHSLEDMMAKSSSQDVDKALHRDSVIEEKPKVIVDTGDMLNKIKSSIDDIELSQTMPLTDTVHESTNSSFGLRSKNLRTEPVSDVQSHISRTERTTSMPTSSPESKLQRVEMAIQKSFSGSIDSFGRVSEADIECEPPQEKPRSRMKISRPSKSVKNRKLSNNSVSAGKTLLTAPRSKILSYKPKKLLEGSVNGHLEAVEEKLNELLDAHGGICKKKDASKGYLKLLLLTAASGDSGNGGAIQSNRDLSMILDAMLKTKSHGVLLDIINKNGLQMLHNMMKLYRRDFKKIPILRKLLKVFEFLAEKEILTLERINGDSLHPGVESLRESILVFTEHDDYQVHQIARSFRDRWIPRKFGRMENFNRRREFRKGSDSNRCLGTRHHWQEQGAVQTARITCSDQSGTMKNPADARMHEASCSQLTDSQTSVSRPRKRKSRWDQPAYPSSPKNFRISPKFEISEGGQTLGYGVREERDCSGAQSSSKLRDKGTDDVMQNSDDDAPPGFSCLRGPVDDSPPGFSSFPHCPPLTLGLLQERFNPGLPVAYGIPLSIVQQFGSLQCGTVDSWAIAPVIPFQPYPPLPPYPRERRQMRDQTEAREGHHSHAGNERDQGVPSTSDASLSHAQNTVATNQNVLHNDRDLQDFPGRRYNRQNKCNNQKPRLPCLRNLDGWGFKGNHPSHPRNGSCDSSMETVANELKDQHLADANHSIEYAGNSC